MKTESEIRFDDIISEVFRRWKSETIHLPLSLDVANTTGKVLEDILVSIYATNPLTGEKANMKMTTLCYSGKTEPRVADFRSSFYVCHTQFSRIVHEVVEEMFGMSDEHDNIVHHYTCRLGRQFYDMLMFYKDEIIEFCSQDYDSWDRETYIQYKPYGWDYELHIREEYDKDEWFDEYILIKPFDYKSVNCDWKRVAGELKFNGDELTVEKFANDEYFANETDEIPFMPAVEALAALIWKRLSVEKVRYIDVYRKACGEHADYLINHHRNVVDFKKFAFNLHDKKVNQKYGREDSLPYSYHLESVFETVHRHLGEIVHDEDDILPVLFAALMHDSIEDARMTYHDVMKAARELGLDERQSLLATEIVYALTNEKGRNRAERANDRYYEGIRSTPYAPFVKMADRIANMAYSSLSFDDEMTMLRKYKAELPHFLESIVGVGDKMSVPKSMVAEIDMISK